MQYVVGNRLPMETNAIMRQAIEKKYPGLPDGVQYVIQPHLSDIAEKKLRDLHGRWLFGITDESGLVSKSIIETEEFHGVLRNAMLLEIERSKPFQYDYIFRIYGAEIVELYGEDMTGKRISEFHGPEYGLFIDLFDIALTRKSLIYGEHAPPRGVDVEKWRSLILPLGENKVEWILVVSLPSGPRLSDLKQQTVYLD
jgi:hypothetical protein